MESVDTNELDLEYSVQVNDVRETDVLVVGGGPSGSLAALSARRNGADVTLLERESYLGGTMTGVMVNTLNAFRSTSEDQALVVEGIALEVFQNLLEEEGTHPSEEGDPVPVKRDHGQFTDPTIMMHVLDEMMMEANVDVLFNTFAFDAIVEDDEIKGVAFANKSGGQVILADTVVDASGDADIAASAGAPFEFGREEDGRYHGGSMLMQVGGIDLDDLLEYLKAEPDLTREDVAQLQEDKIELIGGGGEPDTALTPDGEKISGFGPHEPRDWDLIERQREAGEPLNFSVRGGPSGAGASYEYDEEIPPEVKFDKEWIDFIKSGEVPPMLGAPKHIYPPAPSLGVLGFGMFKHGRHLYDTMLTGVYEMWFDQTDQDEISDAIMYMRKVNKAYMKFLRERIPGFEDAYIVSEAPSVGTRESRRIVGEYILDEDDMAKGRKFPDVVAKSGRPPSAHGVTGEWGTFVSGQIEEAYDIPYRCLVPQEIDDLFVAGRTISVTHIGLSGIRDQGTCMATGEAAGAAAALCSQLDETPRDLDVDLLQKRLVEQGARLYFDDRKAEEEQRLREVPSLEERLAGTTD